MENPELYFAEQFALHTSQHFFLTGKAGTGKTTLLKKIAEKTIKNFAIVAPTGVAAINAGGVTIHSMFSFPITAFIPSDDPADPNIISNRKMLLSHFRFGKEKRRVLENLELLIIDEVSMVRCDILDAIDFTLRVIRKNRNPFGEIQVIAIGDMHQLPPVVKEAEWKVLQNYYPSPYFFDSQAWKKLSPAHIELKKVYRQKDEVFVRILNNIRHKQLDAADFEQLEKRYQPDFNPTAEGYVLLSTHNSKASAVNEEALKKLTSGLHFFEAEIDGDFPENMFPCEHSLRLKEGAQVMFIKNDVDGGHYYNGKLATIKQIQQGDITVTFNDNGENFRLHRETWENITYSVDAGSGKIQQKVLGLFSQYPLRLAWAITIHKSQGLTFDRVIIDAGSSFAAGQVYVALSRCRSLDGIVLHSRISQEVLFNDDKINSFSDTTTEVNTLVENLVSAKKTYESRLLKRLFSFEELTPHLHDWKEMIEAKQIPDKTSAYTLYEKMHAHLEELRGVAGKFSLQLASILEQEETDTMKTMQLNARCTKAIEYFTSVIFNSIITNLHAHILSLAYKSKVKKYIQQVRELEDACWNKINLLYQARFSELPLFTGEIKYSKDSLEKVSSSNMSIKKEKGGTYRDTLDLYKKGKSIDEIAVIRGLTVSTIKGHFAKWIGLGEIDIHDVLHLDTIGKLEKLIAQHGSENYGALKAIMGDELDYGDLRMVINHLNKKKELKEVVS